MLHKLPAPTDGYKMTLPRESRRSQRRSSWVAESQGPGDRFSQAEVENKINMSSSSESGRGIAINVISVTNGFITDSPVARVALGRGFIVHEDCILAQRDSLLEWLNQ